MATRCEPFRRRRSVDTREDITATVHYLKFSFTPEQAEAFAAGPVRLIVDHPEYQADVTLTDEQRAELAGDFTA